VRAIIRSAFTVCSANKYLTIAALAALACLPAKAQANRTPATGQVDTAANEVAQAQHIQEIRDACIRNRRRICGKILKVLPEGLVVDSGYTNLARAQINRSWLLPGVVLAERVTNVVEENEPGCFCFGLVFLTDLPEARGAKPKPYDYVNIEAFPKGQFTYTSIGDVHRTVRKFSPKLAAAVQWAFEDADKQNRK
jgi:hypothetical protein